MRAHASHPRASWLRRTDAKDMPFHLVPRQTWSSISGGPRAAMCACAASTPPTSKGMNFRVPLQQTGDHFSSLLKKDPLHADNVSEWLRRWPAKPLCIARESSNLSVVAFLFSATVVSVNDTVTILPTHSFGTTYARTRKSIDYFLLRPHARTHVRTH